MLATDLDPMMRAKGKHARTHAIMACLTNMPLRLPLVSVTIHSAKAGMSDGQFPASTISLALARAAVHSK